MSVAAPVTMSVPTMAGPMPGPGRRATTGISRVRKSGKSLNAIAAPRARTDAMTATSGAATAKRDAIMTAVMTAFTNERQLRRAPRSRGSSLTTAFIVVPPARFGGAPHRPRHPVSLRSTGWGLPVRHLPPSLAGSCPAPFRHRALHDRGRDQVDDDRDHEQRHRERDERRLVQLVGPAPLAGDHG